VDLVSDAWLVALRRLVEPGSEEREICDEEHLIRLLKRVAQTRFFDALDKQHGRNEQELDAPLSVRESAEGAMTLGESLVTTETAEGLLFFGEKGRALPLIQALFESEEAFRMRCVQPPRRRIRQYQAFVLHCLAEYFQREVGTSYGEEAALLRRYIHLLGVTPKQWHPIEDAVLEAIQIACGASVKDRATWSVLRYELNQLG
jgi:hypothetical protein